MDTRTASLPGVSVLGPFGEDTGWTAYVSAQEAMQMYELWSLPAAFCRFQSDGIYLLCLSDVDRSEFVRSGWGEGHGDGIRLFDPRDEFEAQITWRAVRLAYNTAVRCPVDTRRTRFRANDGQVRRGLETFDIRKQVADAQLR